MDLPRTFVLGPFAFSPLGPDCCDADYVAVTSSATLLDGLFGSDWPRGLTYTQNRADLERHAREWDEGRAFAWVIRSGEGAYMGCAYVTPAADAPGGTVHLWLRMTEETAMPVLRTAFEDWMTGHALPLSQWPVVTPG